MTSIRVTHLNYFVQEGVNKRGIGVLVCGGNHCAEPVRDHFKHYILKIEKMWSITTWKFKIKSSCNENEELLGLILK